MFYDEHWRSLNAINRKSRPTKDIYDRPPPPITIRMRKQIAADYSEMLTILRHYSRFRVFPREVPIRVRFFDDSDEKNSVEFRYPHTIRSTICLPVGLYSRMEKEKRIKLLLHESIHVYQRFYPFEFNKLLIEEFNLNVINFSHKLHSQYRYNPDINDLTYGDEGFYRVMVYKNANPQNLGDSESIEKRTVPETRTPDAPDVPDTAYEELIKDFTRAGNGGIQNEHPYEVFACVLSEQMYYAASHSSMRKPIQNDRLERWLHA